MARRAQPPSAGKTAYVVGALFAGALIVGILVFLTVAGREEGGPAPVVERRSVGRAEVAPGADREVVRLAAELQGGSVRQRTAAARRLAALGPRAAPAVPVLLQAMGERSPGIEVEVAIRKAFRAMGAAAVGPLLRALGSPDPMTRFYAARALGHVGAPAASAVPDLVRVLERDPDLSVRSSAAAGLGDIGRPAAAAIPALRRAAGNPNQPITHDTAGGQLRVRARMAIDRIQAPPGP